MPQQLPDGRWITDDGSQIFDGTSWQPIARPAAPPPPPPPPAPPAPPATPSLFPPGFQAPPAPQTAMPGFVPPNPYATPTFAQMQGTPEMLAVESFAWSSAHPLGKGFLVLVEDIEAGETKTGDPKLTVVGKTIRDNGNIAAGYKSQIMWLLTFEQKGDKKPAAGKFGAALMALKITSIPDPRNPQNIPALAAFLRDQLRGKILIVDVTEPRKGDMPDISIKGFYDETAVQAVAAAPPNAPTMPSGPPPPAPPPPPGYAVSFNQPPPPPGTSAFHKV